MRLLLTATASTTLALAMPAMAQDTGSWTGPYIGGSIGIATPDGGDDETLVFDTGLDGTFTDTVTTTSGADAFSPGFCGGFATGNSPGDGCEDDDIGFAYNVHAGYDMDFGGLVAGVVVDAGGANVQDSVTGFSTTPANYVLTREIDLAASARVRIGLPLGNTLAYATGGVAYAEVENSFSTSNGFNRFTFENEEEDLVGYTLGGGLEQRIGDNLSIGLLYRYTDLGESDFTVNAGNGNPPSMTNPFVNPMTTAGSTDFRRTDSFDYHSVQATLSFRF